MTTIKAVLQADWAPAIESAARFIGVFVACVIVAADWLRFTWQHPWTGLQALRFPAAASNSPRSASNSPQSASSSPRSEHLAPLMLLPAPAPMLLAPAPEPIAPAPAPAPRKRGRRATRQPKAA